MLLRLLSHGEYADGTDRRTDGRTPLDMSSVKGNTLSLKIDWGTLRNKYAARFVIFNSIYTRDDYLRALKS